MSAKAARAEKVAWLETVAASVGEGCRDWPWGLNSKGYGAVRWEGKAARVSHVVLALSGRPRPFPRAFALHSCDRPACAAPWHLRWGTLQENTEDRVARQRGARGARMGAAKLTDDQVRAIRAAGDRTLRSLAEEYGVVYSTIWQIRKGDRWKHVS